MKDLAGTQTATTRPGAWSTASLQAGEAARQTAEGPGVACFAGTGAGPLLALVQRDRQLAAGHGRLAARGLERTSPCSAEILRFYGSPNLNRTGAGSC